MDIRRSLAAALLAAAVATLALGQGRVPRLGAQHPPEQRPGDEKRLEQLVREWADAVVHRDLQKLERIQADGFKGSSEGKDFDRRMLREALTSGLMKVAAWTTEDVKVKVTGNTAVVTGKSKLTNAVYMGLDYSGEYEWTDRFVKQRDGGWRAVSSHSKRVKKE